MKRWSIIVFRKNGQRAKDEFCRYEYRSKDLFSHAFADILKGGCWKEIPQRPGELVTKLTVYLPPHEISEIHVLEEEK